VSAPASGPDGDVVELEVPADPAFVAVVRTATAGLAARLDLTLDRIEDLRIAVDEACTLLVPHGVGTDPDDTIGCRFTLDAGSLTVDVAGPDVVLPEPSAYAWSVLSALVDSLEHGHDEATATGPRRTWLRLVVRAGAGSWS
jgi:serine/threonine-protein kinase RsbW